VYFDGNLLVSVCNSAQCRFNVSKVEQFTDHALKIVLEKKQGV
jgi:hypothetical protein